MGVELLRKTLTIVRISSVWETPPVGSEGPDYLNMALLVKTHLDAVELKKKVLRPLEAKLGRVRSADKNAPRTIDIDIIIFDDKLLDPNLWHYAHRAVPVAEILPDFPSEQGTLLNEIASELAKTTPIRMRREVIIN